MKIQISNINVHNDHLVRNVAGIAGASASVNRVDMCTATIDFGTHAEMTAANVAEIEVEQMIGRFILYGFTVSLIG